MGSGFRSLLAIVIGGLWILAPLPAGAVITCDLTTLTSCDLGTAIYRRGDTQPSGSGIFNSFVRTNTNNAVEEGYNTSKRPLNAGNFETEINNSPTFTRDLLLTEVPIVTIGNVQYREFQLDINQQSSNPLLSLDNVRIFLSSTGGNVATDNSGSGLGTLIYELDPLLVDTNGILLNYNLNSGSGQADMFLDVQASLFVGGTYVYLWSQFGAQQPNSPCTNPPTCINNDGFEEWSVGTGETTVPEPATMFLGGTGLVLFGYLARKRLFGQRAAAI